MQTSRRAEKQRRYDEIMKHIRAANDLLAQNHQDGMPMKIEIAVIHGAVQILPSFSPMALHGIDDSNDVTPPK